MGIEPALVAILAAAGGTAWRAVVSAMQEWRLRQERRRLAASLEIDVTDNPALQQYLDEILGHATGARSRESRGGTHEQTDSPEHEEESSAPRRIPIDATERFAPLLIEYYAYGLTQAKRHSTTSLTMSSLGGLIILVGVGALIFDAQMGRDIAAPSVATAAGVLTNGIAALFHRQANQALKHMQEQTQTLRDDMRHEREGRQAMEQLDAVVDETLRDRLRAAVVLRLSGASLAGLEGVSVDRAPRLAPVDLARPSDSGHPNGVGRIDAQSTGAALHPDDAPSNPPTPSS